MIFTRVKYSFYRERTYVFVEWRNGWSCTIRRHEIYFETFELHRNPLALLRPLDRLIFIFECLRRFSRSLLTAHLRARASREIAKRSRHYFHWKHIRTPVKTHIVDTIVHAAGGYHRLDSSTNCTSTLETISNVGTLERYLTKSVSLQQ